MIATFLETSNNFLIVFGLITCVVTLFSWGRWWCDRCAGAQRIEIRLVRADNRSHVLLHVRHRPRRRHATRAEIQGLMGNAALGGNYSVRWLREPEFLDHIEEIALGTRHRLDIPLTEEEQKTFEDDATRPGQM